MTLIARGKAQAMQVSVVECFARFTGGGAAADCTKTASAGGRNVTSCTYNAATGCYKITFADVGEVFLGAFFEVMAATGAATQFVVHPIAYSATTKTLTICVTDVATPTAHDLATTEQLWMRAVWADSDAA